MVSLLFAALSCELSTSILKRDISYLHAPVYYPLCTITNAFETKENTKMNQRQYSTKTKIYCTSTQTSQSNIYKRRAESVSLTASLAVSLTLPFDVSLQICAVHLDGAEFLYVIEPLC